MQIPVQPAGTSMHVTLAAGPRSKRLEPSRQSPRSRIQVIIDSRQLVNCRQLDEPEKYMAARTTAACRQAGQVPSLDQASELFLKGRHHRINREMFLNMLARHCRDFAPLVHFLA